MLEVPVFTDLTEKEKTSISNRSTKLFTLSGIYQATKNLLQKGKEEDISDEERKIALEFWTCLSNVIPEWGMASRKEVSCKELREGYVHAHGVALYALGAAGSDLLSQYSDDWQDRLVSLSNLDWSRSNTELWEGRAMLQGKMSAAKRQVDLSASLLKITLGVSLSPDEQKLEEKYMRSQRDIR